MQSQLNLIEKSLLYLKMMNLLIDIKDYELETIILDMIGDHQKKMLH